MWTANPKGVGYLPAVDGLSTMRGNDEKKDRITQRRDVTSMIKKQ